MPDHVGCIAVAARTALLGASLAALALSAQAAEYKMTVNRDRLVNSANEPQNWLMMNGDYGATRYSKHEGNIPRSRGIALWRSEEHTSELQSHLNLVCRLLLEKKKHIDN